MDAIELLEQQHREVESLFERFEGSDNRREIFEQLADALALHAEIEEQIFYPATNTSRTEEQLQEAVQEHLQMKRLIADLLTLDIDAPAFSAKMKVLEEEVEHHVGEEEDELFPAVRKLLDESQLQELAQEMEALAEELEEAGEPRLAVPAQTEQAAPLE